MHNVLVHMISDTSPPLFVSHNVFKAHFTTQKQNDKNTGENMSRFSYDTLVRHSSLWIG